MSGFQVTAIIHFFTPPKKLHMDRIGLERKGFVAHGFIVPASASAKVFEEGLERKRT